MIGQLGNLRVECDADVVRKVNQEEVNSPGFDGPLQGVDGTAVELRMLPEPCWGMEPWKRLVVALQALLRQLVDDRCYGPAAAVLYLRQGLALHLFRRIDDLLTERSVYGNGAVMDGIPHLRRHPAVRVNHLVGHVDEVAADALSFCSLPLGGTGKIVGISTIFLGSRGPA